MPKTLLLADDSVTIQKVVGISFANEDVVLLTVDNGDDAIERARESRPDAVLADIGMPGRDGYDVCEAIKSDPSLRHVPVLLLSGTFESYDEERARQVGADGHITKPFEAQALVDRVNELMHRSEGPSADSSQPDATVVVAEAPPAADAFDFFDEEFAQTAPSETSGPAASQPVDESPLGDDDAIELHAAVDEELDADAEDAFDVTSLDEAAVSARGDEPSTVLFDADPAAAADLGARRTQPTFGELEGDDEVRVALLDDDVPSATRLLVATDEDDDDDAIEAGGASFDFGFDRDEPAPGEARLVDATGSEANERPFGVVQPDPAADILEPQLDADAPPFDLIAAPAVEATPPPVPESARAGLLAPPAEPVLESTGPATPSSAHTEALGKEIREHLEKVAWEAFGDLSERIVRDTVARVEAIAWEVIPQMAETLIREEIRRLQDDDDA